MELYCCKCECPVCARLTNGAEIYPHRKDLSAFPFWKCDECGNYVGCHHKTENPTNPLGNIPSPELRVARGYIHALIDPLWKSKKVTRKRLYQLLSEKVGWDYHTASLRSIEDARKVYAAGLELRDEMK